MTEQRPRENRETAQRQAGSGMAYRAASAVASLAASVFAVPLVATTSRLVAGCSHFVTESERPSIEEGRSVPAGAAQAAGSSAGGRSLRLSEEVEERPTSPEEKPATPRTQDLIVVGPTDTPS